MRQENAPVSLSNLYPPPSPARLTKENEDNLSFDHKLIVTNLPPVTEIMLKGRFGQKVKCVVCTDFAHQPSGQAYLSFATREEAETVSKRMKMQFMRYFRLYDIMTALVSVEQIMKKRK